ncbi:RNA polymerase II elongator complex subunit [Arthroderma uncinatum]|uniref:RNA polymerase II elongator complex subunit n=1 Tax=Arthroderma uncinatum TaxID=74035 RepID=UPI00144AED0E|nr:RNA polymerase II elongator complex subunit [Arthroderma uncinatum]KAF3491035.1 RNA polymerase II elongator complex subunit [Arthroderma uncinatum]
MPLIILTGYPCAGLTHRARQLSTLFEELQSSLPAESKSRYKVHIVTSHDVAHPRTVYDAARSEKQARAVVKRDETESNEQQSSEAKVSGSTDSISEVKRSVEPSKEDEQNGTEDNEEPYPPELLSNLIYRYEEPSTASRWDKPLFTVPWDDTAPPVDDIWFAITGQKTAKEEDQDSPASGLFSSSEKAQATTGDTNTVAGAHTATTAAKKTGFQRPTSSRPKIVPHQATAQAPKTDPTALYAIEKTTSEVISTIRKFSLENRTPPSSSSLTNPQAPGITIPIPSTKTPIFIPASTLASAPTEDLAGAGGVLTLPRLQRLRRQWVGMNRAYAGHGQGMGQGTLNQEEVGEAFVRFLNAEFEEMTEF